MTFLFQRMKQPSKISSSLKKNRKKFKKKINGKRKDFYCRKKGDQVDDIGKEKKHMFVFIKSGFGIREVKRKKKKRRMC